MVDSSDIDLVQILPPHLLALIVVGLLDLFNLFDPRLNLLRVDYRLVEGIPFQNDSLLDDRLLSHQEALGVPFLVHERHLEELKRVVQDFPVEGVLTKSAYSDMA